MTQKVFGDHQLFISASRQSSRFLFFLLFFLNFILLLCVSTDIVIWQCWLFMWIWLADIKLFKWNSMAYFFLFLNIFIWLKNLIFWFPHKGNAFIYFKVFFIFLSVSAFVFSPHYASRKDHYASRAVRKKRQTCNPPRQPVFCVGLDPFDVTTPWRHKRPQISESQ